MRKMMVIILMIALVSAASSADLGNIQKNTKHNSNIAPNPGTPDGREGGEDMATAFIVETLPFTDTGNTSDNQNDYGFDCPWLCFAKDVVYSYTPASDEVISVDLCGSGYDTALAIMDGAMNVIVCNDDFHFDDGCGNYTSRIDEAFLISGTEYFIIISGYGSDDGDYVVSMEIAVDEPPCNLTCEGLPEGEPALGPDYQDAFNGGCNSPQFGEPWGDLTTAADGTGALTFCGIAGWAESGRDTDWYYLAIGETGTAEVAVDAEQPTTVYTLTGDCASGISVDQTMTVGICAPGTMSIQGDPGSIFMMWFGSSDYSPPAGFSGYEYNYVANFTGLPSGTVSTDNITFDAIKSLYR